MPRRSDIRSVLILGAGPIVIGQACEFDYSGMQACKALREEGYRVILVNSNPATIMTDPDSADAIYIEPVEWRSVAKVIDRERPDALLPTMGGQTALNCALDLARENILENFDVELIGAGRDAIDMAEDRERFRRAMDEIGLESAKSVLIGSWEEALEAQPTLGFPTIIRPSFTLGGSGGGIARDLNEFEKIVRHGMDLSPVGKVLLEESLLGWKEFEMEVVRDGNDNCIIVCSIENLDPMGVHTGDSITVAPALTLTDKEYQRMRDASIAVLRKIGVDTGGSNVQFAVHPGDGRLVIVEMNPRVSRSSALASKATGFPIAKVAAKLAVGCTLDELRNEITGGAMPASFEPTIDYVVTKIPRFAFEKFAQAEDRLGTQMKSVGEVMAIGRTFQESLQKALCSLETGSDGLDSRTGEETAAPLRERLTQGVSSERLWHLADALREGVSVGQLHEWTGIDPWFVTQIAEILQAEKALAGRAPDSLTAAQWRSLKRRGFADSRLAGLLQTDEQTVREQRLASGVRPVYKRVDTCAAEFDTTTAYLYSCYDEECEAQPGARRKMMILGSGPNRIGQGIEFDYCCVHAALAFREEGFETIMVNCNPETVSTDYDTSDRLYFEPLTFEHVMAIVELEKPHGVVVQYGGQTPLKLARRLAQAGVPIIGTSPESIDLAEDRERFQKLIAQLGLQQPPSAIAHTPDEALALAGSIGYPIIVRPSYVLGGRAMEIVHDDDGLKAWMRRSARVAGDAPVLIDHFLRNATEVDVDAVSDGEQVLVAGIMQHIEQAGIHSGDSACSLPPYSLAPAIRRDISRRMEELARALGVVGLMNAQFAVQDGEIYVLEVNPRASRTVPFVAKATGLPLVKMAARCMIGQTLAGQNIPAARDPAHFAVKEAVFPFIKFPGVDPILGPEMRSTGEVMGVGRNFGEAFAKSQIAAGAALPRSGTALLSVRDADKAAATEVARALADLGFRLLATGGTAKALAQAGVQCEPVYKVAEGGRPHIVDKLKGAEIDLVINTTEGKQAIADSFAIRREAIQGKVCYTTTIAGAQAIVEALRSSDYSVYCLQELHA